MIKDKKEQYDFLRKWAADFTSAESDNPYTAEIRFATIRIVPKDTGGCRSDNKVIELNDFKLISKRSTNNNCFFACCFNKLSLGERIGKRKCNIMRSSFGIKDGDGISPEEGIEIFKKYRTNRKSQLRIINSTTMSWYETESFEDASIDNKIMLYLVDNHYLIVESESYSKKPCDQCGKIFRKLEDHKCNEKCKDCGQRHKKISNCNPGIVSFYQQQILKKENRYLFDRLKEEEFQIDNVIHYDLETHCKNRLKVHKTTIVGYTPLDDGNVFKYFTGNNSIEDFINYLIKMTDKYTSVIEAIDNLISSIKDFTKSQFLTYLEKNDIEKSCILNGTTCKSRFVRTAQSEIVKLEKERKEYKRCSKNKIYIDAFNGANFDHYFLVNKMLSMGLKFDQFCLNNGSIIRAVYKNITFIDVRKHTVGSLRKNLINFNCKVKKGDFDYNKLDEWDKMKKEDQYECIEYLKADVLGLKELYDKLNKAVHDKFKINISSYFSTSHATFTVWINRVIHSAKSDEKGSIIIPTMKMEKTFRPAAFGGRCYKSKHKFISTQRQDYIDGNLKFDQVDDYIIDEDVVSLYPAVMEANVFPVGPPVEVEDVGFNMNGKIGIYYIKYETNKHLSHAILPTRTKEGLRWSLKNGEGYYDSASIDLAIKWGYKIALTQPGKGNQPIGFWWEKSRYIFKSYINELFKYKLSATKGTPQYLLAKIFMNGLYGKCIQRPIDSETAWVQDVAGFWKFHNKNVVTGVEHINGQLYITGYTRDEVKREKSISKPTQLGVFILAYSRKLMLEYITKSNPYFDISKDPSEKYKQLQMDNDFYYTDTDAIQVHRKNMIPESRELGGIANDLGDNCKIMRGIWIAPKLYMLEFIKETSDQPITKKEQEGMDTGDDDCYIQVVNGKKFYYHLRGKGVSKGYFVDGKFTNGVAGPKVFKWQLHPQAFEQMDNGKKYKTNREFRMARLHTKKNSKQQEFDFFSILHFESEDCERTLNKTLWNGRRFIGNNSVPLTS